MSEDNQHNYEASICNLNANQIKQDLSIIASLNLQPKKDGNMWYFLWGENLQEGISGFGKTVNKAVENFNSSYFQEEIT